MDANDQPNPRDPPDAAGATGASAVPWARVRAAFNEVFQLEPTECRAALERICAGDPALKREVLSLLAAADAQATNAAGPTLGSGATRMPLGEGPGDRIGPYKLLERIGQGGFGTVFMAEQQAPVRRRVALKIIKLGMDTRQVVARFEQERQALALMEHPNIARVFDAGATEAGRPYFVMELVRGDPVTEYCRREQISIEGRLALFADVCRAVQHAHGKGIIHRDIKPGNVLVTVTDGKPIPKVIDFGIAKATATPLTVKTLFTEHRALIGTPEYMSPEQADASSSDIDTRSDVYGLGVLLYELLTGATPFDPERMRSAAFAELQRILREEDPPKPSTRVSTLERSRGATGAASAGARALPANAATDGTAGLLRGDLDWIVMKAIEKDRSRRYETASALADDVERHLKGEPVLAAPPSAVYRFGKFARRRRGALLAAGGVALALLIGIAGTTYGLFRARSERDDAVLARVETSTQRDAAQREAKRFRASNDFLRELLSSAGPSGVTGKQITLKEMLDDSAVAIDAGSLKDQPEVEATARMAIGSSYSYLGENERAERHLRRATQMWETLSGRDSVEVAQCLLALAQHYTNRTDFAGAETNADEAVQIFRAKAPEHPSLGAALQILAMGRYQRGNVAEATKLLEESIAAAVRIDGDDSPQAAEARIFAASNLHDATQSLDLSRRALEGYRKSYGPKHPAVARSLRGLGMQLHFKRDYAEAEECYQQAFDLDSELFGANHPATAIDSHQLAWIAESRGFYAEAVARWERSVSIVSAINGPDSPAASIALNRLAIALQRAGDLTRAEECLRRAVESHDKSGSPIDIALATTITNLCTHEAQAGRWEELIGLCDRVLNAEESQVAGSHWTRSVARSHKGAALGNLGAFAAGEPLALDGFAGIQNGALANRNEYAFQASLRLWKLYRAWAAAEPAGGHEEAMARWRARVDELKGKIDLTKPWNAAFRDL